MPIKDPSSYEAITYAWVFSLSSWGGIAGYIRKIKSGCARFSIAELIGEICISGFVGIITFFLCESAQIHQVLAAAVIGISSHMGSRAILTMERLLECIVQRIADRWVKRNDRAD